MHEPYPGSVPLVTERFQVSETRGILVKGSLSGRCLLHNLSMVVEYEM